MLHHIISPLSWKQKSHKRQKSRDIFVELTKKYAPEAGPSQFHFDRLSQNSYLTTWGCLKANGQTYAIPRVSFGMPFCEVLIKPLEETYLVSAGIIPSITVSALANSNVICIHPLDYIKGRSTVWILRAENVYMISTTLETYKFYLISSVSPKDDLLNQRPRLTPIARKASL